VSGGVIVAGSWESVGFVLAIGSRCARGSGEVYCGVFPARRGGVSPWVGGAAPVNSEHGA
jgi:hypothetical protein